MGSHDPVIQDVFEINSQSHKVSLFHHQITWCPQTRGGEDLSELVSLKIRDVLSAELHCRSSDENQNKSESGCCITAPNDTSAWESLVINFAQRKKNSDDWKPKQIRFSHSDPNVLNNWLSFVQSGIQGIKTRPKNMLFFVNPYGGKRKALKIFEKQVRPLLIMCNVKSTVIHTKYRNHVTEFLTNLSEDKLCEYNVVVAVGGDGTMCEVVSGLLMRGIDHSTGDADPLKPSPVPVAVIPAGSSNALSYTLHGTGDATTAAIHLILGGCVPLDVAAIRNHSGIHRFIVGQMSYGHLADTLLHSEKLRWMGPKRYDYAGFRKFVSHATYQGSIDMKICADDFQKHPSICEGGSGCRECMTVGQTEKSPGEWRRVEGRFLGISGANISCRCALSPMGMAPFAHLSDGYIDLILLKKASRVGHLRYLLRTAGDSRRALALPFVERYRVEEFIFTPVQCCEPSTSQDTIIRGPFMESGSTASVVACGCDVRKQEKLHSVWNCDGELFLQPSVRVTVHKNLIRIMSRNQSDIPFQSHQGQSSSRPSTVGATSNLSHDSRPAWT